MKDSWRQQRRKRSGRRQCGDASSSSSSSAATVSLSLLLLLLVSAPHTTRAQPFTVKSSTNEVSHIPWIVEDAVVANQVKRKRERD